QPFDLFADDRPLISLGARPDSRLEKLPVDLRRGSPAGDLRLGSSLRVAQHLEAYQPLDDVGGERRFGEIDAELANADGGNLDHRGTVSNSEAEADDIAVLDHVLFAFQSQLPLVSRLGFAA